MNQRQNDQHKRGRNRAGRAPPSTKAPTTFPSLKMATLLDFSSYQFKKKIVSAHEKQMANPGERGGGQEAFIGEGTTCNGPSEGTS
jgi:hypothetical protein